jgi:hypothetical protein
VNRECDKENLSNGEGSTDDEIRHLPLLILQRSEVKGHLLECIAEILVGKPRTSIGCGSLSVTRKGRGVNCLRIKTPIERATNGRRVMMQVELCEQRVQFAFDRGSALSSTAP